MANGAGTVREFPFSMVRMSCDKCGRAGQYRKTTLLDRFGPDTVMPEVLGLISQCPRRGNYSDPCQAIFTDLRTRR
jgi:hypothetical protein